MPNTCHKCGEKFAIKDGTYDAYFLHKQWVCPECYFEAKPEKRKEEGRRGYSWGT